MDNDNDLDDRALRAAWVNFCDHLKDAGNIVFADDVPADATTRVAGFQYLSRLITLGLDLYLEHNDPLRPDFLRYFSPTRKQAGDNPDAVYLGARIDGRETYRVVGNRGSASYLLFTTLIPNEALAEAGGHALYGKIERLLLGRDLRTEWDGSFELFLSPKVHAPNWIETSANTTWLTIRQFFADWEHEEPITVRIERVTNPARAELPSGDRVAHGLRSAGAFVGTSSRYWMRRRPTYLAAEGNAINSFDKARESQAGGVVAGSALECYWAVQPDEALIIELNPVEAVFWNFEFNDFWLCSMDYRYRLSSLNNAQAVLEEDGSLRVVIAHHDPGVPNWLDAAGHHSGRVGSRWILANHLPRPVTRLVKLADLQANLPANARRISPEQRREQLRRRLVGVHRRFRS